MKKYETGGYYSGGVLIKELEVSRETEKYVYVLDKKGIEIRQQKETGHIRVHDTWDAAHQFLIAQQERKIGLLRQDLQLENGKLEQIKGIKNLRKLASCNS